MVAGLENFSLPLMKVANDKSLESVFRKALVDLKKKAEQLLLSSLDLLPLVVQQQQTPPIVSPSSQLSIIKTEHQGISNPRGHLLCGHHELAITTPF